MKKILHIISQYPGKTGSGIYLQELIREGDKRNYIQGLIAGIPNGDVIKLSYIDKFYPLVFNTEELPFPILGMSDVMPYESIRYCDLNVDMLNRWKICFKRVILNAIEDFKPDIILSHHLWLSTSLVVQLAKDIKVIGICHGTDIRQFEKCPQYRQEVLDSCKELDKVFSLSEEQRQDISIKYDISNEKIIVIGGGYNDDIFSPPLNKVYNNEIKMVYAGKLSYSKGIMSLLRVFDKLKDKYNVRLTLVGSGTGEEEKSIKELGISLGVELLGEVTQKNLGKIFKESDIFVLPSFYEGLSLVTIEALASGLLVVATEIPGLKSNLGIIINDSRVIEYVKLPSMIQVDKPLEGELLLFEDRFQDAIERQIERIYKSYRIDYDIKEEIKRMSWENIFNKIERYF
ncbi:glycosyltransferase family 4 protein [Tissierella sp.]|uniref:glycosyltransferase family 4 protein n=1 Tax=Tissierella sp. TaxID=41274 RepID=UPI0028B25DE6|nr:glycosyltransferase family 4 protein [Tissierella sp.]